MAPFFDGIKSFADVPTEPGIDTLQFLEAAEGLVKLFDVLGNSAFKVVQSDLTGNIEKIRTRYNAAPEQSKTLESLIEFEAKEAGGDKKKRKAAEALLWLTRGLSFTAQALRRHVDNPSEELNVSFSKAYDATLSKQHGFVVRGIFSVAMKACPYRRDFAVKLYDDKSAADNSAARPELEKWLSGLERDVAQIDKFLPPYVKGF